MRSLGIIVYSDGSQAELIAVRCADTDHPTFRINQLAKPRRLTLAPFGILLSLMLLILSGCVHLPTRGDKPICLLDYQTGVRLCEYDTWQACHADLRDKTICYHR